MTAFRAERKPGGGSKCHFYSLTAMGYTPTLSLGCLETVVKGPKEESEEKDPEHFPVEDAPDQQRQEEELSPEKVNWSGTYLRSCWRIRGRGKNRTSKNGRRWNRSKFRLP